MSNTELKSSNGNISFAKHMKICNETYVLNHKIGSGNFGEVFMAVQSSAKLTRPNRMVAIKVEKEVPGKAPQLLNEIEILKNLRGEEGVVGFPEMYENGFEKGSHYLVMELLGPSLSDLMKMCGGRFSLSTTVVLAIQIFERLEYLHTKGYVYRDIKPQNFTMGSGKKSPILYMIDFGLSKRYRDPRVNLHIPYRQEQDFSGTLRYASICSHLRIEHSRRDDLESVCYMLIYFLLGTLPWQNNNRQESMDLKQRLILENKLKISPTQLCSSIPIEFKNILEYCLDLDYYEEPDYQVIQGQLMELYEKLISGHDFSYDWALLSAEKVINKEEMTIKITPHSGMKEYYEGQNQGALDEDSEEDSESDDNDITVEDQADNNESSEDIY